MNPYLKKIVHTNEDPTPEIIRIMTGIVSLSEGIQKFLFPEWSGAGRLEGTGRHVYEFLGPIVSGFEIV